MSETQQTDRRQQTQDEEAVRAWYIRGVELERALAQHIQQRVDITFLHQMPRAFDALSAKAKEQAND